MSKYEAVVAGLVCLDVIPSFDGTARAPFETAFVPGCFLQVGQVSFSTGGPVSNTGLALNKLGIRTGLNAKVGDDLFGHKVQQIVASYGEDLTDGLTIDPTVDTAYSVVISPPGVDRLILHHSGANDTFVADDVRYDLVAGARLFHFGYPPAMRAMFENQGRQLVDMFARAKALGVTTCLDMSLPDPSHPSGAADWQSILAKTLPFVDVFLPSIEEILFMLRRDQYASAKISPSLLSELSAELLAMGARIVGIKMGDRGLYLRTGNLASLQKMGRACPSDLAAWSNRELWAPCFCADVVGTLGSGDATIAGFLSGLLRNLSIEGTLTAAVAVGACNVEAGDALSGIRTWDETMQRIANGWAHHTLAVDADRWHFDENAQLWVGPRN